MLSSTLLLAAVLLPNTLAAPTLPFDLHDLFSPQLSTLSPPPSALPAPASGLTLKAIALGLGTQNYTCSGTNASAAPASNGALATLYDASPALFVASKFPVQASDAPMHLACAAEKADAAPLRRIGDHWFSTTLVPTFDMAEGTSSPAQPAGLFFSGKVAQRTPAPADACHGRDGQAAVPWLLLADDGRGVSRGVSEVYRVETVGGAAPATCAGLPKDFTHDYAALYYFYGP